MHKIIVLDVDKTLSDKFPVRDIRVDSRAISLSHAPAGLIFQVTPEKWPGPAYVWFMFVYATSSLGLKKNTGTILVTGKYWLVVLNHSIRIQKFLFTEV
jgi:hypothetical protein